MAEETAGVPANSHILQTLVLLGNHSIILKNYISETPL